MTPRGLTIAAIVVGVLGVAPILMTLLGGLIAASLDCTVSEAGPSPCLLAGVDLAGLLYTSLVMGYAFLLTAPLVPISLIMIFAAWVWSRLLPPDYDDEFLDS